ncbi:NAD(P)H-hydrate dehydratase [Gaetbulibacter saemankumensis]|uniref:NAD(P)H-hydrate dehydratase n=1 Tax=Gaetbulibacter saemankumensis TaxID=311208 RepID=UPI000416CAC7|nr:NAD(P)H-hydrate dehydratase [Gaetbulibacter saemankumensis]
MKILSKEQVYQADKITIERQQITSTDLMERAGEQIFNWLHLRLQGAQVPIHIFCGIGNNGGDGLVLARHLILEGYNVNIYIVNYSDKRSKDFLINYDRVKNITKLWPKLMTSEEDFPVINAEDIVVDAIFGIGLNRPVATWVKNLFKHIQNSTAYTLSIDIPSGLQTDKIPESDDDVIKASATLTLASPKIVFFLPETAKFSPEWEVLDIGIDQEFMRNVDAKGYIISKKDILPLYKRRHRFAHKGSFGHTLIIGGSYGKIGAVNLCSRAALVTGAGLVTAYVPKCGVTPLQTAIPEVMVMADAEEYVISEIHYDIKPSAIGLGVGLGTDEKTVEALSQILKSNLLSLVIDADAINILASNKHLLQLIPKHSIFTPHPKELERLIGVWRDDFDKLEKVKKFTKTYDCIMVIKGAYTNIVFQDSVYINTTGNPGMATAGSGDVLTGIIAGLISQGYTPLNATVFGVYLHGSAGDLAAINYGNESLVASNIVEYISEAYKDLFKRSEDIQQST